MECFSDLLDWKISPLPIYQRTLDLLSPCLVECPLADFLAESAVDLLVLVKSIAAVSMV